MTAAMSPREVLRELELTRKSLLEASEHEPWGAYYRFQDSETAEFVDRFYPEIASEDWIGHMLLRSSVVVVNPYEEIPMHHHNSRVEIIKVLSGSMLASVIDRCGVAENRGIGQNDLLSVEPGVGHGFLAGPEGVVFAEVWGKAAPTIEPETDDHYPVSI